MKLLYVLRILLVVVTFCFITPIFSQNTLQPTDFSGYWQGVENDTKSMTFSSYWPYLITINPSSTNNFTGTLFQFVGTDRSIYASFAINGTSNGNTLSITFTKNDFIPEKSSANTRDFWCVGTIILEYDATRERLSGETKYTNCSSTNFELFRIALQSKNTFCKGELINIELTGQNLTWYKDQNLSEIVTKGNRPSFASLDKTTTFYVTQNQYNTETPAVPVEIKIEELLSKVEASSERCEAKNGKIIITPSLQNVEFSLDNKTFQSNTTFERLSQGDYTVFAKNERGCASESKVMVERISDLQMTINSTPSSCGQANGEITLNLTNTQGNITYFLNNISSPVPKFQNLAKGEYTLLVKDENNCQAKKEVIIGGSEAVEILGVRTIGTSCGEANGQITLDVKIPQEFEYSIDGKMFQNTPVFSNVKGGTYPITVRRNEDNCSANSRATVEESQSIKIIEISIQSSNCRMPNGIIEISAQNATEYSITGVRYQINPKFEQLEAGLHTLFIKNGHCTKTESIQIPEQCINGIIFPNAFSPNGDNINDTFFSKFPYRSMKIIDFTVYNRWGNPVYSLGNKTVTDGEMIWDGKINNKPENGIYTYRLIVETPYERKLFTNKILVEL